MYKPNPYAKIKENAINTATPEELTLMLYEGALKFASRALLAIEDQDYMTANTFLQKTKAIIREFQFTLNRNYEIAEQLHEAYEYIHGRLHIANMNKDAEVLQEAINHIRLLKDTWKQAMLIARSGKQPESL